MVSIPVSRRTIVRSLAASSLMLPALEIFGPRRARAADGGAPQRFVLMYGGISVGTNDVLAEVVPQQTGVGYDLPRAIMPIGNGVLPTDPGLGGMGLDVQQHVSIVTGLQIPWDDGAGIPPGGRTVEFHYNTLGQQISGMRGGPGRKEAPNGPSADQIAADALGTTTFRSLSYRVQAASYVGSNTTSPGDSRRISWYRDDAGDIQPIDPVFSPQLAYSVLFDDFAGPDPAAAAAAERQLRRRKGVVEMLQARTQGLVPMLSAYDRIKLEQHLDELNKLRTRLDAIQPTGGDCMKPEDPGEDPPIQGAAIEYQGQGGDGLGYSQEDLRAEVLSDLVAMAFACDSTRSAAIRLTFTQCYLQFGPVGLTPTDGHSLTHSTNAIDCADGLSWHVKHFARLVGRLGELRDFDDVPLIDRSALVLLFEGGTGWDPEQTRDRNSHSTENMIALVGGHAGGLNPGGGRHVAKNADWHPAHAVLSCLSATGAIADETLGEIDGRIPELFG